MRLVVTVLVLVLLALPAGARSKRKQCKHMCGDLIAMCQATIDTVGFGQFARRCKKAVLKRCRKEGVAVCGAFCGNGVVDGAEACDGTALGGATCTSLGFASGVLACTGSCAFDTRGCVFSAAPTCGNGVVEAPEQCDGTALGGATCGTLGFNAFIGTLACTAGCGFDTSGCRRWRFPETGQTTPYQADKNDGVPGWVPVPDDGTVQAGQSLAYVDNQDGTITDVTTGLMWEQKDRAGGLHDVDHTYVWDGDGTQETIWDWLDDLNAEGGPGFAGHSDWRIPNAKELQSLVSYGRALPSIEGVFVANCIPTCEVSRFTCGCTAPSDYWSSSTSLVSPDLAWTVSFSEGNVFLDFKTMSSDRVRAVRGGS
jgi:Protein of unknown function (DUF1566)